MTNRLLRVIETAVLPLTMALSSPLAAQHSLPQPAATAPAPALSTTQLLEALQAGGLILLIRHERTEVPSRGDDYSRPPEDCRAQRNLSPAGIAGAAETAVVLRALAIPVARVLTSPMCRGTQTAYFMFGTYETDNRLMHHDPDGTRTLDVAADDLRALIAEIDTAAGTVALISHTGNIVRVTGQRLSEGEIGILRKRADGSVEVLGQVMGSDLAPFARMRLQQAAGQ